MANLTPPIPIKSGMQVTLPNSQFFAHNFIAKWRKWPQPCKPPPTSQFILITHCCFRSNYGCSRHPMIHIGLSQLGYFLHSNSCGWKLLENSQRYTQSSASPPPHHPLIAHCHLGNNHCTSTIHRQRQAIPLYQAIASTPILAEIA
jgi:hypothetical protein